MKNIITYLFCLLTICTACNKLELPNEQGKDENNPVNPDIPPITDDTLSVAQALQIAQNEIVLIKGYMVGYIQGTSINTGAHFDLPEHENSNFLLADHPNETNPEKCMAVKLEKTGKFALRSELNLFEHPIFLKKGVILEGVLSKYFGKNGIIRIFACEIFEYDDENTDDNGNSSDNGNNNDDNGNQNPDNEDNESMDKPSDTDSIGIDNNEQFVPDGRNIKK